MPKILDVSVNLRAETTVWPGSPRFRKSEIRNLKHHDVNVSTIAMDVHTGTHVDAPLHYLDGGAPVDRLSLESMMGPAQVIDLSDAEQIDAQRLASLVDTKTTRLLFKTRNSREWTGTEAFTHNYIALTKDAARWLVDRGIQLVANDYLSIQRPEEDAEVHRVLLRAGVVVVEGVNLAAVSPGFYTLLCLPLKIAFSEAAPARVVLIEDGIDEL